MRLILVFLVLFSGISLNRGQEFEGTFGKISLQIDSKNERTFYIQNALLYENASIDFDTTVQIQDGDKPLTFYYPQVSEGKQRIIRFILVSEEPQEEFYDVIYNLGDSLKGEISFKSDTSKVFFSDDGKLVDFRRYTENLTGNFLFLKGLEEDEIISGKINTSFDLPRNENFTEFSEITMKGAFEVPVGEFRAVSLSGTAPIKEEEQGHKKRLYLAIILSAFALIALGLQ